MREAGAGDRLYQAGDMIRYPKLGATLQRIADDPHTFYNGSLAADIVLHIQERGGIIEADDLARYAAPVVPTVEYEMSAGYRAILPPPSSGAIVAYIINILDGFHLWARDFNDTDSAVQTIHRVVEAFKHGFAGRAKLGDSEVEDVAFKSRIEEILKNMTSFDFGHYKRKQITTNTRHIQLDLLTI